MLCSSVLEYVEDLEGALDWLVERVKPGGTLLVSMPNGASLYRKAERLAFRLTGRPRYYANVRHLPLVATFEGRLQNRGLVIGETRTYAGPAVIRKLMGAQRSGTLFVVAATRGSAR